MLVIDISNGQNIRLNCMKINLSHKVVVPQILRPIAQNIFLCYAVLSCPCTASVAIVFGSYQQCSAVQLVTCACSPMQKMYSRECLIWKLCTSASVGEDEVKKPSSLSEVANIDP